MRLLSFFAGAGLVLAGCASGPSEPDQQMRSALERVEQESYARSERCLSTFQYDSVEVLDDQHLLFTDGTGDKVWLNRLRHRCSGLRPDDILAFDMHGNRLCSLDTATVIEYVLFWRRTGPTCSLGEFHELTEAQASLIREAM